MGNLSTPKTVQKLQKALHAKAKAEAGYRFYALYDKISREDILAHAYAQCRSNKGAPGVDGQDFADIEAYGVERWLGELALALARLTPHKPRPSVAGGRRGRRASVLRPKRTKTQSGRQRRPSLQRRWPSLIPNALAFWRSEPTVRFISLEIFFTRSLSFE